MPLQLARKIILRECDFHCGLDESPKTFAETRIESPTKIVIRITDVRKEMTHRVDFDEVDLRIERVQNGADGQVGLKFPQQRYDLPLNGIGKLMSLVRCVEHLFPNGVVPTKSR